jgi:glucosyl-3-phosphoglycerate synthase
MPDFTDPTVAKWFERRTFKAAPPPAEVLLALKRASGLSIGACLPALDEEATVGTICNVISTELVDTGLVDRLVVIDSGSRDATSEVAEAAGAKVFVASDLVPRAGVLEHPGKGESLWKSLSVMDTDIVVWLDSDTRNFTAGFVAALVAPLLEHDGIVLTKAFYDRPYDGPAGVLPMGGARVTEISVRPLINLLYPELAGFIQPLSGEYAARREVLLDIPFGTGYDVDLLLLIELAEHAGLDALSQVDLGNRLHRNRDIPALGRMSFQIMRTMLERLDESGRLKLADELPQTLTQYMDHQGSGGVHTFEMRSERRPPMREFLRG